MALPFAIATCLSGMPGIAMAQDGMSNDHTNRVAQQVTIDQSERTSLRPNLLPPPDPGNPGPGPGNPPPPDDSNSQSITLNAFDLNTQKHQAKIILSNGFIAIIDGATEKVIMKYTGQTATVSLDKALLKWAHGNKDVANQRKRKLLAALYSKNNNSRLQKLDDSHNDTNFLPSKGHVHPSVIRLPPVYATAPMPPYSCYDFVWGCSHGVVHRHTQVSDHVPYGFSRPNPYPPSNQRGTNYEAWNAWRQDHCDDATSDEVGFAAAGVGGLGAALTLALASGPVGWIAAGLELASAVLVAGWSQIQYQQDERICKSSYPGPGNWP